ncbi:MAG: hypothetical protein MI923_24825, partial [Phycisphaerales bacterium]|nr:hypothetical protein [Phycisphaerales bacterium]
TLYDAKRPTWNNPNPFNLTVARAFSDVDNPFMFQGRPHMALDTAPPTTVGNLMLNDHRARFNDPVIGRWVNRDPLYYNDNLIDQRAPGIDRRGRITRTPDFRSIQWVKPKVTRTLGLHYFQLGLYRFLLSNPLRYFDPFGTDTQTSIKIFRTPLCPCLDWGHTWIQLPAGAGVLDYPQGYLHSHSCQANPAYIELSWSVCADVPDDGIGELELSLCLIEKMDEFNQENDDFCIWTDENCRNAVDRVLEACNARPCGVQWNPLAPLSFCLSCCAGSGDAP